MPGVCLVPGEVVPSGSEADKKEGEMGGARQAGAEARPAGAVEADQGVKMVVVQAASSVATKEMERGAAATDMAEMAVVV